MEHSRADIMVVADQEQLAKVLVVEVVVVVDMVSEVVEVIVEVVVNKVVEEVVLTQVCRWRRRG